MPRARKGDPAPPVTIECPRCGYDVSGVMSTWKNECPLEGRCSECGYGFQWKHLLGPNLGVPKWFFETARRRVIRAAISTSVRTLVPWHFWKRVRMSMPIRPRRLLGLCAGLAAAAYAISIVALTCEALSRFGVRATPTEVLQEVILASRWPIELGTRFGPHLPFDVPSSFHMWTGILPVVSAVVVPACFVVVSRTLKRARVRMRHVFRAGAYAWVMLCALAVVWWMVVLLFWIVMRWTDALFDHGESIAHAAFCWPVAVILFWWQACSRYLRIDPPFWTALLLCIMGMLLSIVGPVVVLMLLDSVFG